MSEDEVRDARPGWEAARWWVSGRVQGVGFRYFVLRKARGLGLEGDVRNLPDGRVEVRVRGPRDRVHDLLASVRSGPTGAVVSAVETAELEPELTFDTFEIR